jgi:hypothetical protein
MILKKHNYDALLKCEEEEKMKKINKSTKENKSRE